MRRCFLILVLAAVALGGMTSVSAQGVPIPEGCSWDAVNEELLCGGQVVSSTLGGGTTGATWPPPGWVPVSVINYGADEQPCRTTTYRDPATPVSPEEVNPYDGGARDPETYPECPPGDNQQITDPAVIAAQYWERIPLPAPRPYVAPGWAITGKLAYLETNGQTTFTRTEQTPVGSLEIIATGRYYVDWGDGETSGPYSFEGRAWPEGEITHDYVWARTYDIVVTERWTAEWRLGGRSGTLRELRTEGRIEDFVARQIQAVVR